MERFYYSYHIQPRRYQSIPAKSINRIYYYEENGRFYEFFTGIDLGVRVESSHSYIESDRFGRRICIYSSSTGTWGSSRYSAATFMEEVKPYLKHRNRVSKAMEAMLNEWERDYVAALREEAAREAKKRADEKNASDFLNDFLDGRRKK